MSPGDLILALKDADPVIRRIAAEGLGMQEATSQRMAS